ncbi:MAG: penicillin-binding protein 2 [Candidatus Obscuribacterales bacterium]|nr:penicillin-binding protein 2 [Steroidobacteraceae bacterium]
MNYGDARHHESRAFSFELFRGRMRIVTVLIATLCLGLVARAAQLQLFDGGFLEGEGKARHTRIAKLAAHRGAILDRNGETLAVSTPVDTVWINPRETKEAASQYPRLAEALNRDVQWVTQRVSSNLDREFLYLMRHMQPHDAAQLASLKIPGVNLQREYRRYYPASEVTGHILGFTNIDDVGQEGLELAYDHLLGGQEGRKRVIRDLRGNTVEDIESIRPAHPGSDLVTSIDLRIQYLAYRELKAAVARHRAQSGSVVIIDVDTGEVLAMVNQPSFNPNDREQLEARKYRNRTATDIFEPGSSIKPFVAAAALATGRYHANTVIDISAGFMQVGIKRIVDEHKVGTAPFSTIIAKSSNLGMTKVAMSLKREQMWQTLDAFGFGQITGSGFPGEAAGMLRHHSQWKPIDQATMSYGYGLSVTPLQLAHAYAILGAGGVSRPLSLRRVDAPVQGQRVIAESIARELLQMMERVVTEQGATGHRAALDGYRVAGKTGTAQKAANGGYSTDRYVATFGGAVPASKPKLAAVVVIDDPTGDAYYGGEVAAPVFANVMAGALRLIGVPADNLEQLPASRLLQASEDAPLQPGPVVAGARASSATARPPLAARRQ